MLRYPLYLPLVVSPLHSKFKALEVRGGCKKIVEGVTIPLKRFSSRISDVESHEILPERIAVIAYFSA
jgi:hypothetical protein